MRSYLVHAACERARIRHCVFAQAGKKQQAMEILKKMEGIAGIRPGMNSLLIFLEPEGNIEAICGKLEQAFPELASCETDSRPQAGMKKAADPKKTDPQAKNAKRRLELKTLLASGAATVGLAIVGLHHVHALAGGVFTLFAIQHIWQRHGRI